MTASTAPPSTCTFPSILHERRYQLRRAPLSIWRSPFPVTLQAAHIGMIHAGRPGLRHHWHRRGNRWRGNPDAVNAMPRPHGDCAPVSGGWIAPRLLQSALRLRRGRFSDLPGRHDCRRAGAHHDRSGLQMVTEPAEAAPAAMRAGALQPPSGAAGSRRPYGHPCACAEVTAGGDSEKTDPGDHAGGCTARLGSSCHPQVRRAA